MNIVMMETASLGDDVDLTIFDALGTVTRYDMTSPDLKENIRRMQDADILVANKFPLNAASLETIQNLKLICLTATGTNNIDFPYMNQREITVCNVKGYSTAVVAQHTFALLLYLYEKLPFYDSYVKNGDYTRTRLFSVFDERFSELDGKNFGIIGMGAIGQRVAKIAEAFGCHVQYYSTSGKNQSQPYDCVDIDTLLATSDIVSVHAPLTENTRGLINRHTLRKMKPSAYLLNLGRGPIVVEKDLAEALNAGWIAGAGLDVLDNEPMNPDNPLLSIQDSRKLFITPHIGWASLEARTRCIQEVYKNIEAWLRGEPRNIVTA